MPSICVSAGRFSWRGGLPGGGRGGGVGGGGGGRAGARPGGGGGGSSAPASVLVIVAAGAGSVAWGVRDLKLAVEDCLVAGLVVADRHPLGSALQAENENAAVNRVLGVALGLLLCNLKSELWIGEQATVLGSAAFDSDYAVGEKASPVVQNDLDAPRLARRVAVPPPDNVYAVAVQQLGEWLLPTIQACGHNAI